MTQRPQARYTGRRPPLPLEAAKLEELALAYVARFSTSSAKLQQYLQRKIRERGWAEGQSAADIVTAAIAARFVELGYVDDLAFARARSGSLLRRGYGMRRIGQTLAAAGIEEDLRVAVAAGEGQQRRAALAMARKRGFGPFGKGVADRQVREKQIAALLRAGHPLDSARELVDATSVDAAEVWAAQADEDDRCD